MQTQKEITREKELPETLKITLDVYFDILDKFKGIQKMLHKKVMELTCVNKGEEYCVGVLE